MSIAQDHRDTSPQWEEKVNSIIGLTNTNGCVSLDQFPKMSLGPPNHFPFICTLIYGLSSLSISEE